MAMGWHYFQYAISELRTEGRDTVPIAGPDPSDARVLRFSAPYGRRSVRWVAASQGDWPDVPAVKSFGANFIQKESEVNSQSPIPLGDQQYLFVMWGLYVYRLVKARPADAAFSVGGLPNSIESLGTAAKVFPAAKFQRFLDTGLIY